MFRQQEQISSLSIFQEISLDNKQSAQAFDTLLQASQVKITYLLQLKETLEGVVKGNAAPIISNELAICSQKCCAVCRCHKT